MIVDVKSRGAKKLYLEVGKALSEWGKLEDMLCGLFAMASIASINDPIGAVSSGYWAIPAFEGKLKMTNAALRFRLADDALLADWSTLMNVLRNKAKKRAELAHGAVVTWRDGQSRDVFFLPFAYQRMNSLSDTWLGARMVISTTDDTRPPGRLYKKDIKQRRKAFAKACSRVGDFRGRVYRELDRQQKEALAARERLNSRSSSKQSDPRYPDSKRKLTPTSII